MVAIRNWKDSTPVVAHDSAIVWRLFLEKGNEDMAYQDAPLEGIQCITLHRMQAGKSGDQRIGRRIFGGSQHIIITEPHRRTLLRNRFSNYSNMASMHLITSQRPPIGYHPRRPGLPNLIEESPLSLAGQNTLQRGPVCQAWKSMPRITSNERP